MKRPQKVANVTCYYLPWRGVCVYYSIDNRDTSLLSMIIACVHVHLYMYACKLKTHYAECWIV